MSYADILTLFHSEKAGSVDKLVQEYEAARLEAKEGTGSLSGEEESSDGEQSSTSKSTTSTQARRNNEYTNKRAHALISEDIARSYGRGRTPGRQPKLKKSRLLQKITGRKNGRPIT
ncbi:hypothetical protein THRCLA_21172 [Thraustotheca clavata]|uniref:Uncharacterized protein n=1 Tax=Thraustotheca clavata TaxID=74557 RepID=A0A1V9ZZG3_9STRA|nr:hypothetical protein THRCLA_21172 [Thraustotheca clavata]